MNVDVERMPRGGPRASCLDRLLQTDRLEYLDHRDVDVELRGGLLSAQVAVASRRHG